MWCAAPFPPEPFPRPPPPNPAPPLTRAPPPARAAADLLGSAYRIVTAVCEEEPPTAARLAEFYGKVVVCLHEAFSGQGFQLQRSLDAILRNAKLKAPA